MGNIRIPNINKIFNDKTPKSVSNLSNYESDIKILYKDIKFDINNLNNSGIFLDNSINSNFSKSDLETLNNEQAIINSLKNILQTSEYSRLLNPEMNIDLRSYLFAPLDRYLAYFIATEIIEKIPFYEPRVNVENCKITVDYEFDRYIIYLTISIPSLNNKIVNLQGLLDSAGYTNL